MKQKALTNTYLSIFCAEMAMIFHSGIPLSDGVMMLMDDADKDSRAVLQSLLDSLDQGASFPAALRSCGCFPAYMTGMAETGEKTGRPAETMKALSEYYDRLERMELSVRNAVFYPVILLIIMVSVVLVLITRVLPVFHDVFGRLGSRMPPLAVHLMRFGGWLGNISILIAAVFGVLFVIAFILWLFPKMRESVGKIFKNKWGGRGIFGDAASSHFVSAMALSLASGLDTDEAAEIAAKLSGGAKSLDKRNAECLNTLRSGGTLPDAMGGAGILSAREIRMLTLGVRGGMTDAAMEEIARRKERAVQDRIDCIVGRIEPVLAIITSVIVGIILLSVMLPLMGVMTSIG